MAIISPFKALRPNSEIAQQVASRPYDVLNSNEARVEANGNAYSFLHITKSEIDLPAEIDSHSTEVYEKAKENLQQFINKGVLLKEDKPCYYIYQLIMNGRSQTGLVCVSSVQDYFDDVIKKHEFTRPEKEKDRIDHMQTIQAQTGNVFLAYRDVEAVNSLITEWKAVNTPAYDFAADDGIRHTVWIVDNDNTNDSITQLFKTNVPFTYIADGHHRAASAAKVSKALPDSPAAGYFLTTIFPASELAILDYNRLVKDLDGFSAQKFISLLQDDFYITLSQEPVKPRCSRVRCCVTAPIVTA